MWARSATIADGLILGDMGDPDAIRRSGSVLVAAALAEDYGFTDIDGRQPRPLTLADV